MFFSYFPFSPAQYEKESYHWSSDQSICLALLPPSIFYSLFRGQVAAERIAKRAVELYDAAFRLNASDFPSNLNILDEKVYKDADIPERLPPFEFSPHFKQVRNEWMNQ